MLLITVCLAIIILLSVFIKVDKIIIQVQGVGNAMVGFDL